MKCTVNADSTSKIVVMARLIASIITIKDLISSEPKDGEPSEEKEKESVGFDPYVSMKFRGEGLDK